MNDPSSHQNDPDTPSRRPRTQRWFPLFTLIFVIAWLVGIHYMARHVERINLVRLAEIFVSDLGLASPADGSAMPATSPPDAFGQLVEPNRAIVPPPATDSPEPPLSDQVGIVEGIIATWRKVMQGAAGAMALLAVLAHVTRRRRPFMLLTAAVILLATTATLLGMAALMHPQLGGLPRLSNLTFILVGSIQAAYAVVLLIVFIPRPPH